MNLLVPLLPPARGTALLRAMLLHGDEARASWNEWTRMAGDVKQALARDARVLLALLHDSARRNGLQMETDARTYLRSASLTESLRSRAYGDVVDELSAAVAGFPVTLIKGGAVRELWYPAPSLRHAHDIEVHVDDIAELRSRLSGSRFHRAPEGFVHSSGLPLRVHVTLPIQTQAPVPFRDNLATLDATDALALTLVHASRWISRATMQWACDATFITRNATIDHARLAKTIEESGATRRVRKLQSWLATNFGAAP